MLDIVALDGMPDDVAMLVPRDVADQIRAAMSDPRSSDTRRVVDSLLDEIASRSGECALARFTEKTP
jgi:hypothetical protein